MRLLTALLGLMIVCAACRGRHRPETRTADPASRRATSSGDVVGFTGRYGSFVWLGLPYAAPPVGELRWRAPVPPAAWSGVREALAPGAPCVQYASPLGGIQTAAPDTPVGDEDCLTLNVYAPRTATPTSFLPVMVWIHGGGNTVGAGTLYDGGNLAATQNVVVVTLNYRLGPFGWLRHAALRDGAPDDVERSGNFGTLDLVRALDWVQSNAAAFGGDPARVTVFGESAGAANTMALLLSPQAVGLFHRAISESGGLRTHELAAAEAFTDAPDLETANSSNEAIARMFVNAKRARDRGEARAAMEGMPPAELQAWLRRASAYDVLRAYRPLPKTGFVPMATNFGDGVVLPTGSHLEHLRRPDGWSRVPVVLGTNRDETKTFLFGSPLWIRRWLGFLPRSIEPDRYDLVAQFGSTMWKATGADDPAAAMRASGATDVYVYRFDWDEEPTILGTDLAHMLGAGHGFEIPFVFGHFDLGREANRVFTRENEPGRLALAKAMMTYWAGFARDGRPSGDALPAWPAWDPVAPSYLVLDTDAGGGIRTADGRVTRASVLAAIATTPELPTPRDRCLVLHDLVFGAELPRAEYDAKCPAFPFDRFPWREAS
jgi:para-nitrobenzyl esterase